MTLTETVKDGQIAVTADYDQTNDYSVAILEALDNLDASVGYSALACAMTLGRLMADRKLESEEEIKFIEAATEWAGMYWAGIDGTN